MCITANDDSANPVGRSPDVLPTANPFAFRAVRHLRNDYKRRRRQGPEGVAHSTSLTPIESANSQ